MRVWYDRRLGRRQRAASTLNYKRDSELLTMQAVIRRLSNPFVVPNVFFLRGERHWSSDSLRAAIQEIERV